MSDASGPQVATDLELDRLDDATVAAWHAWLTGSGFDSDYMTRVERIAPRMHDRIRLPIVKWWLQANPDAAARAARVWAYADAVPRTELEQDLPGSVIDALADARVWTIDDGMIVARVRVTPFFGVFVVADPMDGAGDPVMGPGATTMELGRVLGIAGGESVLDVGCGAGSLALVAAAAGAGEVVGVDIAPRAVEMARFNARLNQLRAEFIAGDLLDPVGARTFDVVVAQPPFVVKPPDVDTTVYLHGGEMGDELAMRLLREVPPRIRPGGRALIRMDSPVRTGQPVGKRVRDAVGSQIAVLVVRAPGNSPDAQAIAYASVSRPQLGTQYAALARRYREHLATMGIEACDQLLVRLSPRAEDQPGYVVACERALGNLSGPQLDAWHHSLMAMAQPPAALAALTVRPAPDTRLLQIRPLDGPADAEAQFVVQRPGQPDFAVNEGAAFIFEAFRDADTVAAAVRSYAQACDAPPADVAGDALAMLRRGVAQGLLVVVGGADDV